MRIKAIGISFIVTLVLATTSYAQTAPAPKLISARKPAATKMAAPAEVPKTFGKAEIYKFQTAGFTDQQLVAIIEKAENKKFSDDDLIELKTKVSERVFAAILGIPYIEPTPAPAVVAAPIPVATTPVTTAQAEKKESCEDKPFSTLRHLAHKCGDKNDDNAPSTNNTTTKGEKLKDGQPAVIHTSLSAKDTAAKVQEYLKTQLFPGIEPTASGMKTDWSAEHRCKGSLAKCQERAEVTISTKGAETVVEILVSQKHRNAQSSNASDKGPQAEPTMKIASELRPILTETRVAAN